MNIKKHRITKKRHLEMILQNISSHKYPKVYLEQYKTPAHIAADVLWNAFSLGDIYQKNVIDPGCGTGILAIGAAILGANKVYCIDIDSEAVEVARDEAIENEVIELTDFFIGDIANFEFKGDTVIQNPPFGAQKGVKNADRIFMEKSLQLANVVYSFHLKETQEFVEKYFTSLGGQITNRFYYRFNIPKIYDFHKKESVSVDVVVFRVEKNF